MEEFSDTSQADISYNKTADIPIFNTSEIISSKTALPQPVKNAPPLSDKGKKADNQDDSTQALFDYMAEQVEIPVASTSKTFEESKSLETIIPTDKEVPSELVIDKPETSLNENKPSEHIESSNEVSSTILLSRA